MSTTDMGGDYMPFLTASRVDLFEVCAMSAILPTTYESSDAAEKGTATHEAVLQAGELPRVALEWFGGTEPRYEAAFGWRPATGGDPYNPDDPGRSAAAGFFGENIGRSYGMPGPEWLAGTADAVQVRGATISVADLKTGYGQTRGGLPSPRMSGQLRLLAWMVWQWMALSDCIRSPGVAEREGGGWPRDNSVPRIRLAWIMHPEGGETRVEDAEVPAGELHAWAQRLSRRAFQTRTGQPQMVPGPHCQYCPCFESCPAQGGALARLHEMRAGGPQDLEDARVAAVAIPAAARALQNAKRALRVYVEREGGGRDLPIGDGRALRVVKGERRDIDARVALQAGIVPPSAARVTVTQTSIREAVPNADMGEIMAKLEAAGAVSRHSSAPHVRMVRDGVDAGEEL